MIYLNLLNKIFGPKKPLTREEIDELKQGHSSHDLESKLNDDGFNQESMEGWKDVQGDVNSNMSSIDEKMKNSFNNNISSGEKNSIYLFIGVFCAAMVTLIIYTYQGNTLTLNKTEISENTVILDDTKVENSKQQIEQERISKKLAEVDKYSAIDKKQQITKEQLKRNAPDQNEATEKTNKSTSEDIKTVSSLEPKDLTEVPTSERNNLSYRMVSEVYLNEFKAVDYRTIREDKPIELLQELPTGTPANQSNNDNTNNGESDVVTKKIDYVEYLKESQWLFSKNKFKRALKRYIVILEHYPNDVNAHFYSGLCYHNLGQYEKAISHFDNSYSLSIGNFREEARWFKAKAFIKLDNISESRSLLNSIKNEKGFYSEEAAKLLLSLN